MKMYFMSCREALKSKLLLQVFLPNNRFLCYIFKQKPILLFGYLYIIYFNETVIVHNNQVTYVISVERSPAFCGKFWHVFTEGLAWYCGWLSCTSFSQNTYQFCSTYQNRLHCKCWILKNFCQVWKFYFQTESFSNQFLNFLTKYRNFLCVFKLWFLCLKQYNEFLSENYFNCIILQLYCFKFLVLSSFNTKELFWLKITVILVLGYKW